jgi:hypothetical protein
MLFCDILTLNHYTLLFGYHAQHSAGSAFVGTSYNLYHITFFYMRSHFQIKNQISKLHMKLRKNFTRQQDLSVVESNLCF